MYPISKQMQINQSENPYICIVIINATAIIIIAMLQKTPKYRNQDKETIKL